MWWVASAGIIFHRYHETGKAKSEKNAQRAGDVDPNNATIADTMKSVNWWFVQGSVEVEDMCYCIERLINIFIF